MQDSENYELDPNFAVVCSFLERFGKHLGDRYADLSIEDLKAFLEAPKDDVNSIFVRLHLSLIRGIGNTPHKPDEWYKDVIKFCKDFPDGDDVLVKEKGYANVPIPVKLRILKNLFEDQFEYNDRFNRRVNEELEEGTNLRHEPVGKDKLGRSYWFMLDKEGGLRLFRGWQNGLTKDETWNIVCCEVEEVEKLIESLEDTDDLIQEDPPVRKPPDMSPVKKISPKDLLSTATEDAANVMYFSSIMNSPRFFKPPKARTKAQILQAEKKFDLPHCDVEITRLSEKQLSRYLKQDCPSLTTEEDNEDSKQDFLGSDKIKGNTDIETTTGDTRNRSSSDQERNYEGRSDSERADYGKKIEVDIPKDITNTENDRSAMNLENDSSEMEKEVVCDNASKDFVDSGEAGKRDSVLPNEKEISRSKKENKEVKPSCDKGTCQANSGTCVSKGKDRTDSRHKGKANTEEAQQYENEGQKSEKETREMVGVQTEKSSTSLINNKGDACCKQDIVVNNIDKKQSCITSNSFNLKDIEGKHNAASDDEKNVFDNAIQDLIQLERKTVIEKSKNGKNSEAFIKEASVENDIETVKRKLIEKEQVDSKQDKEETLVTDSDHSLDNDKQVIDNALKDLMQLEEMSQGSPASTCLSPTNSTDLNLPKVGENRTAKNCPSKEDDCAPVDNTASFADEVPESENVRSDEKLKNKVNDDEKTNLSDTDDFACQADFSEAESNSDTEKKGGEKQKVRNKDASNDELCDARKNYDKKQNETDSFESFEGGKISEFQNNVVNNSVKTKCNVICDDEISNSSFAGQDSTIDDKKVIDVIDDKGVGCQKVSKKLDTEKMVIYEKEKPKLSTKIKETCHAYKEELPVNEFLAKIMNVIEGKREVNSDNKSETEKKVSAKIKNMETSNNKITSVNGGNIKESRKTDEKKPLSMMVGEEMIQIEVASDNSDEESGIEDDHDVNNGSVSGKSVKPELDYISETVKENLTRGNVYKHEKMTKVSEVVQNKISEYLKCPGSSNKLKVKSEQEAHQVPVIDLTTEKEIVKALYAPNSIANNTLKPSIVYLSPRNTSQLPSSNKSQVVSSAPAVRVSNNQTAASVADLLRTIYVPMPVPPAIRTTLPSNGAHFQTINSVLTNPIVSTGTCTYPVLGNNAGVRMVVQSQPLTGAVTLPYIHSTAPRIIYAPSQAPSVVSLQKSGILGSSRVIPGKPMQNNFTPKQIKCSPVKSLLKKSLAKPLNQSLEKGNNPTTIVQSSVGTKTEPSVSVQNVTIVVGKDGIHYDKATGRPYLYPADKKYVIAGPKGQFYDKETGYEVNVPQSENLEHRPGTVYLASGVSFTSEVMKKMLAMKLKSKKNQTKVGSTKKAKKNKHLSDEITTSDEEFEKLLESDLDKTSDDEESDDPSYDYEKISQHIRAAKDKKLPVRRASLETADSEREEEEESDVETVTVVLGRNAKRAAAMRRINYAEVSKQFDVTMESSEEEPEVDDNSEPCKVCNNSEDPSSILLCDKCDGSYHMSCLSPPLSLVPLEDWYCPQCEHTMLIESLREKVKVAKRTQRKFTRGVDRISVKTFSIDSENILEVERRSCRTKKEVSYNEANYDKIIQKAVKEMNKPPKSTRSSDSCDSESETDTKRTSDQQHQKKSLKRKATKRHREGARKSARVKKSSLSGKSKAKRRKLTSLEDDSGGSGSEYVQSGSSDSSDTEGPAPEQEDMAMGGIYFTSSGRKTKNVSYT